MAMMNDLAEQCKGVGLTDVGWFGYYPTEIPGGSETEIAAQYLRRVGCHKYPRSCGECELRDRCPACLLEPWRRVDDIGMVTSSAVLQPESRCSRQYRHTEAARVRVYCVRQSISVRIQILLKKNELEWRVFKYEFEQADDAQSTLEEFT
jgi:hypothetical protein